MLGLTTLQMDNTQAYSEFILGYTLAPLTWLLGVCKEDIVLVSIARRKNDFE